jgi:cyclic pyranopterin phosphate synthase
MKRSDMNLKSAPLVDSFGRRHTYLRLSVIGRCNLHCVYCQPQEEAGKAAGREDLLSFAEIVRLAGLFSRLGVTKLRLTGGEPLMRENIAHLIRELRLIPGIEEIGLTTNGVLLQELIADLKDAGLKALNLSLDTLRPERFLKIAGEGFYRQVMEGFKAALAESFEPLKLNTVIIRGLNDDELLDFVELARERPVHVRFIEYMPFRSNKWRLDNFISALEMKAIITKKYALVPEPAGENGSLVAREYRIDGFRGAVGFISPLSAHFCNYCNRLRVTADGSLKLCLYHPEEISLSKAMRQGATDQELEKLIRSSLERKPLAHPSAEILKTLEDRAMSEMGG